MLTMQYQAAVSTDILLVCCLEKIAIFFSFMALQYYFTHFKLIVNLVVRQTSMPALNHMTIQGLLQTWSLAVEDLLIQSVAACNQPRE